MLRKILEHGIGDPISSSSSSSNKNICNGSKLNVGIDSVQIRHIKIDDEKLFNIRLDEKHLKLLYS